MKIFSKRWFCGWLTLCLLLGMVSAGLAEGDAAIELVASEANGDAIGLELDLGNAVDLPDDAGEGLVPDDSALVLSLEDDLDLNGELADPEVGETQEAASQRANDYDDEDFDIDENGVLVRYYGPGGDVTIPYGVTSIGGHAFSCCTSLTSATIPSSVTSIGEGAFRGCINLTGVTIPKSVTRIKWYAFFGCTSLTDITIPNRLTSIEDSTFRECTSLTDITIPNSVKSIDFAAFLGCSKLTDMAIPSSVKSIGEYALYGCTKLNAITIPNSVTSIGNCAFFRCESLPSVTIPGSVRSVGVDAFSECTRLTDVTISDGVTSIGEWAFSECPSLSKVTIPDSVTSIGGGAFQQCFSLPKVTIPGNVTSIEFKTFYECTSLTSVTIHDGVKSIGDNTFDGCNKLTKVIIPASVDSIGEGAFSRCENLTIYGEEGSYAETYAAQEGIKIVNTDAGETIDISKAKVTVSDQVYTGKQLKPAVKVVLNKKTLKRGRDYTVTYKKNKAVGTATVTVKGKGNYSGTAKGAFKINPKAVKGFKLVAGKGQLMARWKKAGGITGYQLQYGLKKNFKKAKKVTVKAAKVKRTLKKLKTGKTYYVRVRAFKKVKGKTYYSAWSAAKKAKVK